VFSSAEACWQSEGKALAEVLREKIVVSRENAYLGGDCSVQMCKYLFTKGEPKMPRIYRAPIDSKTGLAILKPGDYANRRAFGAQIVDGQKADADAAASWFIVDETEKLIEAGSLAAIKRKAAKAAAAYRAEYGECEIRIWRLWMDFDDGTYQPFELWWRKRDGDKRWTKVI
jgi:hypothetical protein